MDELLNRTEMKKISEKAQKELDNTKIQSLEDAKLLANKSKYKELIQKLKAELSLDKLFERDIKNYSTAQYKIVEETAKDFNNRCAQFNRYMAMFLNDYDNEQLLKYVKFYDSSVAYA